jgi:long-chain acyl-CoA synthetase
MQPGALVGLAAPNGPAFLAGFVALRRTGQAALLLDPLAPHEDRRRVVTALGASAVLECADPWPSSAADFCFTRVAPPAGSRSLPGVAVVKLTSGSTGVPRGVAMRTEHLLADEAALTRTMGLRDDDRLLGAVSLSHSYGFTTLALSALVRGLTLVIPADRGPFSSLAAARDLSATVFPTVPAYIEALLKLSAPPAWPSGIRLVISAGAFLPSATAAQFRYTYGQPVHVFYGSSECGGICYDREGGAGERGTVGTPVEGVRLSLMPVEHRSAGEGVVVVESPGVGETYLPERDARLGSGRFETSDVGVWQGDEIVLRRRVDRMINVRGRKVDPSEVETILAALDGVAEVVVIGMASPDGRDEIVRAVMACPAVRPSYRDVTAWCRNRLADYKVPRSVVFVDAIPRTPRGKIDRSALLTLRTADNDTGQTHG